MPAARTIIRASRTTLWCAAPAISSPTRPSPTRPTRCSCAHRMPSRASARSSSSARASAPGVLAVLTAADMEAAGVGNVGRHPPLAGRGGKKLVMPHRPALARERVMHVGEPVALVVAETLLAAQDAAELVAVDYEELKPAIDRARARAAGRAATVAGGARQRRGRLARARRRSRRQCPRGRAHHRIAPPMWRASRSPTSV